MLIGEIVAAGIEAVPCTWVNGSVGETTRMPQASPSAIKVLPAAVMAVDAGLNVCTLVGHWHNRGLGAAFPWTIRGRCGFGRNDPVDVFALVLLPILQNASKSGVVLLRRCKSGNFTWAYRFQEYRCRYSLLL